MVLDIVEDASEVKEVRGGESFSDVEDLSFCHFDL
jgi:hypothetical protein